MHMRVVLNFSVILDTHLEKGVRPRELTAQVTTLSLMQRFSVHRAPVGERQNGKQLSRARLLSAASADFRIQHRFETAVVAQGCVVQQPQGLLQGVASSLVIPLLLCLTSSWWETFSASVLSYNLYAADNTQCAAYHQVLYTLL